MEFDENDEEFKAEQLVCGHQFSACAWTAFLKDKIKSEGAACVFAKCMQLRCNVVVPHSLYLKYVKDEEEDG